MVHVQETPISELPFRGLRSFRPYELERGDKIDLNRDIVADPDGHIGALKRAVEVVSTEDRGTLGILVTTSAGAWLFPRAHVIAGVR